MRVMITGSSGQIGTNLALRCLQAAHDVIGVDCRGNTWTDAFTQRSCDLAHADATAALSGLAARPDVVVHLAAHAKVHELVREPHRAFENIAMTRSVLEYCRVLGIPIVYASSREVYGDVVRDDTREADADFSSAASPYSASKLACESMVYAYARCYGLPYLVLRLSNVYGRYDDDLTRMERVIPLFIEKISNAEPIRVFGAGKVLDFTYVDDCVDGLFSGTTRLVAGGVRNETINLAYGEGNTLSDLVGLLSAALGKPAQARFEPPRAGEIMRYVANLERARRLLDFYPRTPLRDGILRTVEWNRRRGRGHREGSARSAQPMPGSLLVPD